MFGGRPRLSSTPPSPYCWLWSGAFSWWGQSRQSRVKTLEQSRHSILYNMKRAERHSEWWSASCGWKWPVTCHDTTSGQLDTCFRRHADWSWPLYTSPLCLSCSPSSVFCDVKTVQTRALPSSDSRNIHLLRFQEIISTKGFSCTMFYLQEIFCGFYECYKNRNQIKSF